MAIVAMKGNVKLYIGTSSTLSASDKLGHVSEIGDMSSEAEDIDVSDLDSQSREYENGFDSNGNLELTLNLTDAEFTKMKGYKDNGTDLYWGLTIANKAGTHVLGLSGQGQVKSVTLTGLSVGGIIQVQSVVRISGNIGTTFTDPS